MLNNIQRSHNKLHMDISFVDGKLQFDRLDLSKGSWERKDNKIKIKTMNSELNKSKLTTIKKWKKIKNKIISNINSKSQTSSLRIQFFLEEKEIKKIYKFKVTPKKYSNEYVSILLKFNDLSIGRCFSLNNLPAIKNRSNSINSKNILNQILNWINSINEYNNLPVFDKKIQFSKIIFSPISFGFIIHEAIGHRAESDDFSQPLIAKTAHFKVIDSPNVLNSPGYSPIDDNGTIGRPCKIYGFYKNSLLNCKTGNLRAIDHRFHPIVRQRTLEVLYNDNQIKNVPRNNYLIIDDIENGTFDSDTLKIKLNTSIQIWVDQNEKKWRLPSLNLTLTHNDLKYIKPFGSKSITSPGGGCSKNYQNNLPIGFNTPSALYLPPRL